MARLENPLESIIAVISVFGSRMLGLSEDGTHLLIWDMNSLGELPSFCTVSIFLMRYTPALRAGEQHHVRSRLHGDAYSSPGYLP